jgi:hypothetical protein
MPVSEGQAGIISSTGRITVPALYTGVSVADLVNLVGGLQSDQAIEVTAEDGYSMTFSYDQVMNGDFITYDPGTGTENQSAGPLQMIFAYAREGEPLDQESDGTLRVMVISGTNDQIVDGHWSIKWVNSIRVIPLSQEWTLQLDGAINVTMERGTFESCASPSCHGVSFTDDQSQTWEGVPLWRLVAWVDDQNSHEPFSFVVSAAESGYDIELVGADGSTVTVRSTAIIGNDELMIANQVNGNPLSETDFPLRLIGGDIEGSDSLGQIIQLILHLPQ